jgi:hypothetical protein
VGLRGCAFRRALIAAFIAFFNGGAYSPAARRRRSIESEVRIFVGVSEGSAKKKLGLHIDQRVEMYLDEFGGRP